MTIPIFGDENARNDIYLYKCQVPLLSSVENQPILRGRWGVGKTATLLLRHRALSKALKGINPEYEYIWYLDERTLSEDVLFHLFNTYAGYPSVLKRSLEKLWHAEIVRSHARTLNILYDEYGRPPGKHWDAIRAGKYVEKYGSPVWQMVSTALETTGDIGKAISGVVSSLSGAFTGSFQDSVRSCLKDIIDHELYPVTVIEPVETPRSMIDGQSIEISRFLLVSLLDLVNSNLSFSPKRNQMFRVELSVPWNRQVKAFLREPQRLPQYSGSFTWSKGNLRAFMNKRIENEFQRVRRQYKLRSDIDAWAVLFDRAVNNRWSDCVESSFDYFLRHTHHRARDIMRLARTALHAEVDLRRLQYPELTVDDVLRGGPNMFVTQKAMRSGVEEAIRQIAENRIEEGCRRYADLGDVVETLRAARVPFDSEDLAKRCDKISVSSAEAISELWEAGIVGYEVFAKDGDEDVIAKTVGESAISTFRSKANANMQKYFLFEYNTEMTPPQIERTFCSEHSECRFVVHPVFSEYLGLKTPREYPIGV
jgi:hypothetical protein